MHRRPKMGGSQSVSFHFFDAEKKEKEVKFPTRNGKTLPITFKVGVTILV